jgi:hypothetical protein
MSPNSEKTSENKKLGTIPFVFSGMSFIPLIGVLFGLFAIARGLITKRDGGKKLALVGGAGIGFNILIYGALFYFGFVQRGGIYDDLRTKMAQSNLNALVQSVEFYKIQYGEYPDSLEMLKSSLSKDSSQVIFVIDPRGLMSGRYFYYQKVDSDHYYLRGVAPDGQPFSPGALVPQVATAGTKLGLLIAPPPNPSSSNP